MKRFSHNTTGRMLLIACSLLASACGKKANYSSVPDAPVFIQISLDYYPQLRSAYQYACFTPEDITPPQQANPYVNIRHTGYGGILIYTTLSSLTPEIPEYHAFDMACPYEKDKNIRVYPDSSSIYAVCEQCGSRFDLSSLGMAASESNPSKENLKRHEAIRSGNILTVRERISY